jgi:membrane associated rhomboid family serine protease
MGIGAAAACYAPRWPVAILLFPIPMPLWVAAGGYFLYDYYYLKAPSNVGHAAHLGGFAYGAVYGLLLRRGGIMRFFGR